MKEDERTAARAIDGAEETISETLRGSRLDYGKEE